MRFLGSASSSVEQLLFVALLVTVNPLYSIHASIAPLAAGESVSDQANVHRTRRYGPSPLPAHRRNAALLIFEGVHPLLTIHYSGFSRKGNIVCYDMMNELRTVEEAQAMMDVEFHLLDQMLAHYGVQKHMRIVDVTVVRKMFTLSAFYPWKLARTISNISAFVASYNPILKKFLKRYLKHIEMLVLINVPSVLVPLIPALVSRISGAPRSIIAALPDKRGLEQFMEPQYIPREFGNANGATVVDNDENNTAWCIMLREIERYIGAGALTQSGNEIFSQCGPLLLASWELSRKRQGSLVANVSADEAEESSSGEKSNSGKTEHELGISTDEQFDDIE